VQDAGLKFIKDEAMVKNYNNQQLHPADADETIQLREQADVLLQRLIDSRSQSEQRFAENGQRDAIKCVTGRSALEDAIEKTRCMIQNMDALLDDMQSDLQEEAHSREALVSCGADSHQ